MFGGTIPTKDCQDKEDHIEFLTTVKGENTSSQVGWGEPTILPSTTPTLPELSFPITGGGGCSDRMGVTGKT